MSYPHEFVTAGSGSFINDEAGEALGKFKLVYRGPLGTWLLADADALTTMPPIGLTLAAIAMGSKGRILKNGYVADATWTWTVGGEAGKIYASTTAGELTQTAPVGVGDVVHVVAVAFFSTGIWFAPTMESGGGYGNSLVLPFVDGTTFLNADAPFGWEIDATTEYAIALGVLPVEVNTVLRWKIYATSVILEADAMRLEIEGYGGASDEPYTTETVAVANHPSTTTNFAANDVIYWIVDATDDVDIDDMVGGDQIMIKVLHEIAGGADCATDAIFTCVEIEYV